MFWLFKKKERKLPDDFRFFTDKEFDEDSIDLSDNERVVVSTARKKLYWRISLMWYECLYIKRIYDYVISWNSVFVKTFQDSTDYLVPQKESEFRIKHWEICVDWIYKEYNEFKKGTLEERIEKYKQECLLNPLNNLRLVMFILSKSLKQEDLKKAAQEKINLMYEWRQDFKNFLSLLWLSDWKDSFSLDDIIAIDGLAEEKWNSDKYQECIDALCKKCWCADNELTYEFEETIEELKSYLK